jgi:thioredoxin-dependent peroxiredoxin
MVDWRGWNKELKKMLRFICNLHSWQRCLGVFILSFPLALGIRWVLQQVLPVNLAKEAIAYVRAEKPQPLSEPLQKILAEAGSSPKPATPHPRVGQVAGDFTLKDDLGNEVNLYRLCEDGPVVVVFYYGYYCPHCVSQLFGIGEDLRLFKELGARVIAVSPDLPTLTAERFREYGRFDFSVLSDLDNQVAQTYGVYRPASEGRPEEKAHGTFLIGKDRHIFWAQSGPQPFLDNKTLLYEVARHTDAR